MARSAPTTRGVALRRREQILAAALVEFATHGYSAARTADIAHRAGITQPYIYTFFTDKQELFLACHAQAMQRLRQALFRDVDRSHHSARALASVESRFRGLVGSDSTQLLFQLQSHAAASNPEIRDVVRARFIELVDDGVRFTGAPRQVVLEQLARGLLFSVAVVLDLPSEYRLSPLQEHTHDSTA